jgi:hypothetical protein
VSNCARNHRRLVLTLGGSSRSVSSAIFANCHDWADKNDLRVEE